MTTAHICTPSEFTFRAIGRCRRCRARRRLIVTLFMWYGPIVRCCHCGAYVNDGYLKPPRKHDAQTAQPLRQTWPTLPNVAAAHRWLHAELERETA